MIDNEPRMNLPRSSPFTAIIVAALAVGAVACQHAVPLPEASTLTDAGITARLSSSSQRRHRVDAVIKAGLPGPAGAVVSATVDVAAEAPRQLSVSVRSFFEVPTQILVANDDVVTLYDASSGTPRFSRGPANDKSLQRVLGVPLVPDDVVALILGRAPVDAREGWSAPRIKVLAVDANTGTYTASIERAGRGTLWWTARFSDDALVKLVAFAGDGRRLVEASCSDHRLVGEVAFAHSVRLRLVPASEGGAFADSSEVILTVRQATFNGPSLPPEAFVLEPPPGTAVGAL